MNVNTFDNSDKHKQWCCNKIWNANNNSKKHYAFANIIYSSNNKRFAINFFKHKEWYCNNIWNVNNNNSTKHYAIPNNLIYSSNKKRLKSTSTSTNNVAATSEMPITIQSNTLLPTTSSMVQTTLFCHQFLQAQTMMLQQHLKCQI